MRTRKRKNGRKRGKRLCCFLCVLAALAATGVMLAYLTDSDSITNLIRIVFPHPVNITVTEPEWDATGETEAEKTVAGKGIEKDPYVKNKTKKDVYVRLKIDFAYTGESGETAVTWDGDEGLAEINYNKETCRVNDGNKDKLYSRFLSTIYYGTSGEHLLAVDDTGILSSNPYFYYSDGWFYYVDYDGENGASALKTLEHGETTEAPLFTSVELPVFDAEYGLFASGFKITVTAEAVSADKVTDAAITNIGEIADVFGECGESEDDDASEYYGEDSDVNEFIPAGTSISVRENDAEPAKTGDNEPEWVLTGGTYKARKEVKVHCDGGADVADCYVRVCLLPEWDVKGTSVEILGDDGDDDIEFPETIGDGETSFTIGDATFNLADGWADDWIYKDGYFYYKNILVPGEDTPLLLESVEMAENELDEHTGSGESLSVSVLADAVQADGGAVTLKWKAELSSEEIVRIN